MRLAQDNRGAARRAPDRSNYPRIDGARARSDIVWVGGYPYLRGTLQAGRGGRCIQRRTAMNGDPPRKPKSARRVAFAKWAFVGAIAGAAVISACSQPSDSQQTAQQQASDEQAR